MTRHQAELLLGTLKELTMDLVACALQAYDSNDAALAVRSPWRSYQLEYHSRPSGRLCPSALSLIYR